MTEKSCRLDVRISEEDRLLLKRRCEEFEMTQTDYMRMLINLPLRMVDEGMETRSDIFVIDRWGAADLSGQLRRFGYHYNQGIRALNTIAYYMRLNEADHLDVFDALENATDKLEIVERKVQEIQNQLKDIVGKRFGVMMFEPNKYAHPNISTLGNSADLL